MKTKITPKIAATMLQSNTKNRPLSEARVNIYAKAILSGDWLYNGESIKISDSGVILDGQHRLRAVLIADKAIFSEVIEGIHDDTFSTIDQGKPRTNADIFALNSVKYASAIASMIAPFRALNNMTPKSACRSTALSKKATYEYYLEHTEVLLPKCARAMYVNVQRRYIYACHAYLLQFNDAKLVDDFFTQLETGRIRDENSALWKLRDWMLDAKRARRDSKPDSVMILALVLKTFVAVKNNKDIKCLRYKGLGVEKFPYDNKHIAQVA